MTNANPEYRREMLTVVEAAINYHPRSLQKRIGPSGLGTPCTRKLGFRLAQTSGTAVRAPAWRPTVGTATHAWLTDAFNRDNENYPLDKPRWLTDTRVKVGEVAGEMIDGSLDLYDIYTKTVIDWKIPGPSSIRDKKRNGPGDEYKIQVQLYGRGVVGLGLGCEHVGILFMPSNGELSDSHYWTEPYSELVAVGALVRAGGIALALAAQGPTKVLPQLHTANDHCSWCPWFAPGAKDLSRACPGDPGMQVRSDQFTDLIVGAG